MPGKTATVEIESASLLDAVDAMYRLRCQLDGAVMAARSLRDEIERNALVELLQTARSSQAVIEGALMSFGAKAATA